MDEEVGTQERGSALFRVLAGQTKMRIDIKHADIKFYMFKKRRIKRLVSSRLPVFQKSSQDVP